MANTAYGGSIVLRAKSSADLVSSWPWLVGSLGTILLDVIICTQAQCFDMHKRRMRRLSGREARLHQPLLGGAIA